MIECKNCNTHFEGNYCPQCGQRPNSGRIKLRESFNDIISHYIDLDIPLISTIRDLFIRPGKMIRKYISGTRKQYSNPIRYYIFILAAFLIIKSLIGFDPVDTLASAINKESFDQDAVDTRAARMLSDHANLFSILFVFYLGLLSKTFFRKEKYYFAEHLTMSFFTISQYTLMIIFVMIITKWYPAAFFFNYVLVFLYPMYVLMSFHKGFWLTRLIKSFFVILLSWLLYVITAFLIAIAIASVRS